MPFNPQLSQPQPAAQRPQPVDRGRQPSTIEGINEVLQTGAEVFGPMVQERRERQAAQQQHEAMTEFQTSLIEEENRLIADRETEANLIQESAQLQARQLQGQLGEDGAMRLEELQREKEELEMARAEGGLTEGGTRYRMNLMRKRALNDPRLAGLQSEINQVFGRHDPADFDPLDDILSQEDRQRLGPNPSSRRVSAILAEHQVKGELNFRATTGGVTANKIDSHIRPLAYIEGRKGLEFAQERYRNQGALTQEDISQANALFDSAEHEAVQAAMQMFASAQEDGHIIASEERNRILEDIRSDIDRQRRFLEDRDLLSRVSDLNQLEEELLIQGMPGGLGAAVNIGSSGGSTDIMTALNVVNMSENQMNALFGDGDMADLAGRSAEMRLKVYENLINGVEVPGYDRLKSWLGATSLQNGTTEEGTNMSLDIISRAQEKPDMESALRHLNKGDVQSHVREHESSGRHISQLARTYAHNISRRQPSGTITVVQDGQLQIRPVSEEMGRNPTVNANISMETGLYEEFNALLRNYSDVIDTQDLVSVFEQAQEQQARQPLPGEPTVPSMQELEQEQQERMDERGVERTMETLMQRIEGFLTDERFLEPLRRQLQPVGSVPREE